MRIAVGSQNLRTVTPHAGRTRRFLVFDVGPGGEPIENGRLDLAKDLAMHDWHGAGPHPLDSFAVVISGSFGPGFARRMAARGIAVVPTRQTDPLAAVKEYLAGAGAAVDTLVTNRPGQGNATAADEPMP